MPSLNELIRLPIAVPQQVARDLAAIADAVALAPLPARVAHIDDRIPDLSSLPGEVERIRRDIARLLEMTPDPDEPGTLDKVRDALAPG